MTLRFSCFGAKCVTLAHEKGSYLLIFEVPNSFKIRSWYLERGLYCYVGSAWGSGGLRARLLRHFSKTKRLRWHIDYVLQHSNPICAVIFINKDEDYAYEYALQHCEPYIKGFGSTDTKHLTHLFKIKDYDLGRSQLAFCKDSDASWQPSPKRSRSRSGR